MIKISRSIEDAYSWYTSDINRNEENPYFPVNRLWICATNKGVDDINCYFSNKETYNFMEKTKLIGITNITESNYDDNQFSIANQIDMVNNKKLFDIPDYSITLQKGDPVSIMRNIETSNGIVKNKRAVIEDIGLKTVTLKLNDELYCFSRMEFFGSYGGVSFSRFQFPLKNSYASTVHKAQGLTLDKVVLDLREDFWEHGQLYVGLSRIRDPHNLCILINSDSDGTIKNHTDEIVVHIVKEISNCLDDDSYLIGELDGNKASQTTYLSDSSSSSNDFLSESEPFEMDSDPIEIVEAESSQLIIQKNHDVNTENTTQNLPFHMGLYNFLKFSKYK